MDSKQVRDAVALLKSPRIRLEDNPKYDEIDLALDVVLDLAESVLAVDRESLRTIIVKYTQVDRAGNVWTNHEKVIDAILSAMKGGGE